MKKWKDSINDDTIIPLIINKDGEKESLGYKMRFRIIKDRLYGRKNKNEWKCLI